MKIIIKIFLILILPGCGIILINENNYRNLKDADKSIIKPFDPEIVSVKVNNNQQLFIYEINTDDILNCANKHKFTWVHLWRPFCPHESCQNINYYLNIEKDFKTYDLELLLVSESYDLKLIENIVRKSDYDKPIFVLQDSCYGHKIRPNRLKFFRDFNTDITTEPRYGFDDYLLKDTVLIYAGEGLDNHKIDSLIMKTTANN
jgi:hypothetical protein